MISDTTATTKYVGIGTNSPDERVHIIGNQKIEGRTEILNAVSDSSVFIGVNAGINDDGTDNHNTAIGANALFNNTSGFNNTASGQAALYNNTTVRLNTALGYGADADTTTGVVSYATVIGYFSKVNASNKVRIDNLIIPIRM